MNIKELHQAIFQRLEGSLSEPVYDRVPQDAVYPFVTVGDDDVTTDFSTDDSSGSDTDFNVHVWSRYQGSAEIRDMMDEIASSLDRYDFSIENFISIDVVQMRILRDPDGKTRHGVITFRALIG